MLTLPDFTHGPPDGLTSYTTHLCALNLTERPPMVLPASVTKPSICPALYSPFPLFPSVSISNSLLLSGVSLSPSLSLSQFCFSFLFFSLYLLPLLLHIHTFSLSDTHPPPHHDTLIGLPGESASSTQAEVKRAGDKGHTSHLSVKLSRLCDTSPGLRNRLTWPSLDTASAVLPEWAQGTDALCAVYDSVSRNVLGAGVGPSEAGQRGSLPVSLWN